MSNIESLLDENPFVQKRRAEGFAEGEARGKVEGLQFAIMASVENRFPPLVESVKEKISRIQQPDKLQLILKVTFIVPDEKTLQTLIDSLAA